MARILTSISSYSEEGTVPVRCHTGNLMNMGSDVARINGVPLQEGQGINLEFLGQEHTHEQEFQLQFEGDVPESQHVVVTQSVIQC